MSEPIWCTIEVAVPPSWVDVSDGEVKVFRFPGTTGDEGDWPGLAGEERWDHGLLGNGLHVISFQGEGNYGLQDSDVCDFLTRCEELGVPYIAHDETKYEFQGEVRVHGRDVSVCLSCDNGGAATINAHEWAAKRTELAGFVEKCWSTEDLYRHLHEWLCDRLTPYGLGGLTPYGACAEALASEATT